MEDKVFLIGNGINNIDTSYTWSCLITDLIDFIGASGQISQKDKPFPLLYEEIIVEAVKNRKLKENVIKQFIADKINQFEPNPLHHELLNCGVRNILTTNYDFTFEKVLVDNVHSLKNDGIVKESTYSVFRHYTLGNHKIWHIHGDANYATSITLGYEHYSGYLQQMRNYIVTGTGTSYKNVQLDSFIKRKRQRTRMNENHSWLDFFFRNDIYIIGLTLDFIEIHLWWLLTFRQRSILTKGIKADNKIVYFYPSSLGDKIHPKLQLLKSFDIFCYSCKYIEGQEDMFYKNVISLISEGRV